MESPPPAGTAPQTPAWQRWLVRLILGVGLWFATLMFLHAIGWIKPPLERVAVFRTHVTGYQVCPATDLHDCRIRGGTARGRDRTIVVHTIAWQANCDTQEQQARDACERESPITNYADDSQVRRHRECMASRSVVDGEMMAVSDPRDPHLPANAFELTCREGEMTGTFQDEGL